MSIYDHALNATERQCVAHTIQPPTFKTLNKTEQEYVLYVMGTTAAGESISRDIKPPSRNASLVAIQELEKAGVK